MGVWRFYLDGWAGRWVGGNSGLKGGTREVVASSWRGGQAGAVQQRGNVQSFGRDEGRRKQDVQGLEEHCVIMIAWTGCRH